MVNEQDESPDIFLWGNQADAHKDELKVDVFMFTKGYTVYRLNYAKTILAQLKVLFLYDMIAQVQTGAATGARVCDFSQDRGDDNTLLYTRIDTVEHAQEVIEQIAYGEDSIDTFDDSGAEVRKIKGIVARFQRKGDQPFYIVKYLPSSSIHKGATSWALTGSGRLESVSFAASLAISPNNETLILGNTAYAFSPTKFMQQFGYVPGDSIAMTDKVARIEKLFKLKYPDGVTFDDFIKHSPALGKSLRKADPESTTQENLIEQADEFGIELMCDDATGAIILMDTRDAIKFVNLLNDDYVQSNMTGARYLATAKKRVNEADDAQVNLGI